MWLYHNALNTFHTQVRVECDQHKFQISLTELRDEVEELTQKIAEEKKANCDIEEYLKGHYKVKTAAK